MRDFVPVWKLVGAERNVSSDESEETLLDCVAKK
jgi:hypothetical protein